jgi:sulfate adenylyltransferase
VAGAIAIGAIWKLMKLARPVVGGLVATLRASRRRSGCYTAPLTTNPPPTEAPVSVVPRSLLATPDRVSELRELAQGARSWDLTARQICDLELLLDGSFAPLEGFLDSRDTASVAQRMRLAAGALWPMPILLDVPAELGGALHAGDPLALRDAEGALLGILEVSDAWQLDPEALALAVFGTLDRLHPGVSQLLDRSHPWAVGGRLEGVELPVHHDFVALRRHPADVRADFARRGWERVVAFQTRNPLHRSHVALTLEAAKDVDAHLLLHPAVGATKPGDVDHFTRVRCYQHALRHYPEGLADLALLPLAMRMGGPREAVWHGLIRRNYGCTHFIVGRDHAGPGRDSTGRPFYGPYEAQELFARNADEIGLAMVGFEERVFVPATSSYQARSAVPPGAEVLELSGSELRRMLESGEPLPSWYTFPEIAAELRRTHPERARQGFTVLFTGLSGAGKSTLANALAVKLLERGGRPVTLLDGDLVRKNLSSELGFSREHRDLNVRRIGWVAGEITRHGGVALCAPIAPYDALRRELRASITPHGGFLLVHVSTAIEVCESRDRKGLYAKARAGLLPGFTGVSDPYEVPADAELVLDAGILGPAEAVQRILDWLTDQRYLV